MRYRRQIGSLLEQAARLAESEAADAAPFAELLDPLDRIATTIARKQAEPREAEAGAAAFLDLCRWPRKRGSRPGFSALAAPATAGPARLDGFTALSEGF